MQKSRSLDSYLYLPVYFWQEINLLSQKPILTPGRHSISQCYLKLLCYFSVYKTTSNTTQFHPLSSYEAKHFPMRHMTHQLSKEVVPTLLTAPLESP